MSLISLWDRNLQVLTDLAGKELKDLAVPGNGRRLVRAAIDEDSMISAFSEELATVAFEMTNEIASLH